MRRAILALLALALGTQAWAPSAFAEKGWPLKVSPPYDSGPQPCIGNVSRLTASAFPADRATGYICKKQYELAAVEITKLIDDRQAYVNRRYYLELRAELHERMGKTELAAKDSLAAKVAGSGFNEIRPDLTPPSTGPSQASTSTNHAKPEAGNEENDFALCEEGFAEACTRELNNKQATWCRGVLYMYRGAARLRNGEIEPAESDFALAFKNGCGPGSRADAPEVYKARAEAYFARGNVAKAIADISQALDLSEINRPDFLRLRADCYKRTGDIRLFIADLTEMIRISYPEESARPVYAERGEAYEKIGETELAKRDYEKALAGSSADSLPYEKLARSRLAAVSKPGVAAQAELKSPPPALALPPTDQGKRIALVIGNSAYSNVRALKNAAADARAVAASLRNLGFEVIEKHDLNFAALIAALKSFGDKAPQYDWALVYYAGHGIEVGGTNYLIPVDAELALATHVDDEAVPLNRVLAKVEGAQKLRLVILDACRENPFIAKMASAGGTRSVGRGLARVEPSGGVLVAYSARDGQLAQDGDGENSPFAQALLAHIDEAGLEINMLFRKVRDDVKSTTKGQQEPFTYGSLPAEALYFKAVQ
jgi:tetratricopeptide (TPR) repeat protein